MHQHWEMLHLSVRCTKNMGQFGCVCVCVWSNLADLKDSHRREWESHIKVV